MTFATTLRVVSCNSTDWQLLQDLWYQGKDDVFVVPRGFVTDFATVPWWSQSFIPRTGTWTKAAVLHDYLCTELFNWRATEPYRQRYGDTGFKAPPAGPRDTDGIFRRVMREEGVDFVRRWLMWTAVRWAALANPARRPGWHKDAPLVLGITLLALVVLAALVISVVLLGAWLG